MWALLRIKKKKIPPSRVLSFDFLNLTFVIVDGIFFGDTLSILSSFFLLQIYVWLFYDWKNTTHY